MKPITLEKLIQSKTGDNSVRVKYQNYTPRGYDCKHDVYTIQFICPVYVKLVFLSPAFESENDFANIIADLHHSLRRSVNNGKK